MTPIHRYLPEVRPQRSTLGKSSTTTYPFAIGSIPTRPLDKPIVQAVGYSPEHISLIRVGGDSSRFLPARDSQCKCFERSACVLPAYGMPSHIGVEGIDHINSRSASFL